MDPHVKHLVPGWVIHFGRRLTEVRWGDQVRDQDVGFPRLRLLTLPEGPEHPRPLRRHGHKTMGRWRALRRKVDG